MRTAFILASLATTLVALNPQAEGEAKSNSPENSSLHVPQRASSPMVRVGEDSSPDTGATHSPNGNEQAPTAGGTDTNTHIDNSNERPEVVMDSKDPSAADADKDSSKGKEQDAEGETDGDKHGPADKEEDNSLPGIVHKFLPNIAPLLFPEESSSTPAPTPTMGSAAAASARGELFHFDDAKTDEQTGAQQRRAVMPQAAPAPAVTEQANAEVVTRTVTRTETCACASSVNGVLAKETGASGVPAPAVHSSNAAVATDSVVAMPSAADPMAATPTMAATPVHAGLTEESAVPSAHGVRTELTSGSVLVHSVSAPAIKSETRTVVASATPVSHSAFVGVVPSSSTGAMPTGVDPQRNSKDEQLFTGGAAWTGPREMVVMGVTGFLAVMMML